ncbi:uncharacterized protein Dana_GF26819 [Drosophila ananassae]|uniref:Uncharacterized protein n=1 Tax=Drosophila ananassae TaxID=7217 RepID=A0A0P8XVV2_DROAN|nr:uncharacterized protein Dana_GF26819 [Drosophila ananassae]
MRYSFPQMHRWSIGHGAGRTQVGHMKKTSKQILTSVYASYLHLAVAVRGEEEVEEGQGRGQSQDSMRTDAKGTPTQTETHSDIHRKCLPLYSVSGPLLMGYISCPAQRPASYVLRPLFYVPGGKHMNNF